MGGHLVHSVRDAMLRLELDPGVKARFPLVFLPENLEDAQHRDDLYDAQHTLGLCKALRARGVRCGNSADLGLRSREKSRHGAEVWLGLVWLIETGVIPVVVEVLKEHLAGLVRRAPPDQPSAPPEVVIGIRVERPWGVDRFDYRGTAEVLPRLLAQWNADPARRPPSSDA